MIIRTLLLLFFFYFSYSLKGQVSSCISKLDSLTGLTIYENCEVGATPKLGFNNFYKSIGKTINFSSDIKKITLDPKIFIGLIINENSEVSDIRVLYGSMSMISNKEMVLDLLKNTEWSPAVCSGKMVNSLVIIPITICLK
ncbi:hypothetical protein KMW28_24025 [Flammeovirga yaeyamensis]|uniref:Uncharacterized protein n=1 Tax=Flammeovirga yaeyamensis TaxID=367791 RepID=A0AAX1NDB2_9BACT|nr:hypothetical protein [Flammeovirga yaeyamensis]MBB3696552.1 hypothetical protein [Flammeovirga yaeyamensis]NMF33230.1 hypothetical protein [Flammeovirga yaeyamensis]QWG05491.1 hypothetical protein KMW28_24025 [Flammeovirga yaeyamensis]